MKSNSLNRFLSAILFTMSLPMAFAADGTWNSTTSANWNVATNPPWAGGITADGSGFTANFNTLDLTADVTVTLGADRTIGNLTFGDTDTSTAAGWTITGSRLYLASATATTPVVTVNALGGSKEVTISSVLMGTQGFVKEGAGILNLSAGNNGFGGITGGIVVNNGILKLSASSAIRGELTINSGGEVRQNASWSLGQDGGGFDSGYTKTININGGILNFAVLGGGLVANVNMTGGEIKSVGNGNVDWYNTPVGGSRTLTTLASGSTALVSSGLYLRMGNNNGGTAIFDVADGGAAIDFKISGVISEQVGGSQNLLKKGAGTMELTNANSFAGITKVAAGVLKITNNLALQNSALDTSGAGTVTVTPTTLSLGGLSGGTDLASVITSGYTGSLTALTLNTHSTKTLTYSGVIANGATGMTLTKSGSGTQVLSGANSYTGGTIISGGKLIMTTASSLGNGALNVGGNTFIYAPTAAGALNIGSGVLTLANGSTIGTALGGTASQSAITSTGAASLAGTGKVNVYGINGVAPTVGTNNLITAGSGLTGGTYTLGAVFNNTDFTVSNFIRSSAAISVDVAAATALSGNVSWKGGLTGYTGVWAASNGSTQSNWQVTDGVNQPLAPGASADLVFSTATSPGTMAGMSLGANMTVKTLTINNTSTAFGLTADGFTLTLAPASSATGITINTGVLASTVAANVALGADQTWTNNSANAMTVSGTVSGAYNLTKAGTGLITLSGNNTYTGATTISTGTLALTGINSYTGATTIATGATFTVSGAGLLGVGSYAGNIANAGTFNYEGANDQTLSGVISGAGQLIKAGNSRDSKLTLTGVNTYTGATSFYRGSLEIGGAGQLGSGSYAGNIITDSNANWAGTLFYNSTANQTLSGVISGAGSLTKTQASTLTLSGSNSFSGLLSVQQGTLSIGTINNASSNGALGNSANAVFLGGAGGLTGTLAYTGGTASSTKKFTMATGGTGAFDVTTGATTLTLSGVIDGSGALTKTGTGKLTLSGTNIYSGATTIKAGTLALASAGTFANSATIIVGDAGSSGTVLDLTAKTSFAFGSGQTVKGIGNINIGSGKTVTVAGILAPGNSIGTISETGNLTLTGTLQSELGTAGATPAAGVSDRTTVTGDLDLTGSTLQLINNAGANGDGSAGAGAYRLMTYGGTLTGTFGTITNPISATLHEKVTYGGGNVDLNLYRLASGNTATTVNLGKSRVGGSLAGNLSVTNNATADGFSEILNASTSGNTGGLNSSGSVSGLIAGASSSTINVNFSTATSGARSGTTTVNYESDGTGTSGYGTTGNGSQIINVTGDVYDLATVDLSQVSGTSITGSGPAYTLDFGVGLALNTTYTATFSLANGLAVNLFKDSLTGDYGTLSGPFSTTAADFTGLAAGSADTFSITFYTGSAGTFTDTFTFGGTSVQSGLSDVSAGGFTISLTATAIPEPRAALLGGLGLLMLLRRRRM